MNKGYFKKLLATGLAAISMMSIFAAASVTANAATVRYSPDATSIEIPDSVTSIGDYEFKDFKKLETVIIGKNVKEISPTAFIGCPSITRFSVKMGNQHFSVENGIYLTTYSNRGADMKRLIRVATGELFRQGRRHEVPKYIYEIGDYAYESAFSEKNYLNELRIENDVISIGAHAFEGCRAENIIIGENVRYIGAYAFCGNKAAKTVNLSYNLNAVGDFAFSGCDNLTGITYNNPKMLVGLGWNGNAKAVMSNSKEVIAFDVNGGDIFSIPKNIEFDTHSMNNELIYTNVDPVRSGCAFAGWTDENGHFYRPNSRLNKNVSTLLHAKWEGKAQTAAEKTTTVQYYVKKSETTSTNPVSLESAENRLTTNKSSAVSRKNTPVRIDEETTAATTKTATETTTKVVEKTTNAAAYAVVKKSSNKTADVTEKRMENTVESNVNRYSDESFSIVTAAKRSADSSENTMVKTTETTVRATSSTKKTEGGKKLNVFQRLIAFIKSLFSKKG